MSAQRSCRVRRPATPLASSQLPAIQYPASQPRASHVRALDDLRFIRETMERSSSFTAVPGYGQVAVGISALVAAGFAYRQTSTAKWLLIWLSEAVLAIVIAAIAMEIKARRTKLPLTSGPGRKFAFSFFPPIFVGAILTLVLWHAGLTSALPGTWLLLYGTGVVTGGAFSVPIVPVMGICMMALGLAAFLLPAWSALCMAVGFGALHIFFGIWIAREYGG